MKTTTQPLLKPGDIFSVDHYDYRGNKRVYWKVTAIRQYNETSSYSVIKCSKTGKEYKRMIGYSCDIDKTLPNKPMTVSRDHQVDYNIVKRNTAVGVKADIDHGLKVGKLKRRLGYLQARMESDKAEVYQVLGKLANLEGSFLLPDGSLTPGK